ncbi:MAG: Chromosome partition protein Smc [Chloroflexi bacterium]|nr:Chromosome partition protein Smc [Chloroflexota bacterium]
MELEQLEKRLDWLDDEHRKDKIKLDELEDKILSLEGKLDAAQKKNVELDGEVTRLKTTIARVDDFDESLAKVRVDSGRSVKDLEKQTKNWIADAKTLLRSQMQGIDESLKELRSELDPVGKLEKQMTVRIEEETRLTNKINEVKKTLDDIKRASEEQLRQYKLVEENRQRDNKRLTDIHGEVTAARKRLDEQRARMDLVQVDVKKSKQRLGELDAQRRELQQEQEDFIEKESLKSAERENTWRSWQTRFEAIEKQAAEVGEQLQSLDTTHRTVKHMQSEIEDITEQVDRRVNEITEMQRLADERFRQEWNTFKADDQKRWMNYTLSQKEQRGETERYMKGVEERVTILEDTFQEVEDQLRQATTQTGKQLQNLLTMTRDWVSEYEQVLDSVR